jgi:tryptophan synthase alpha subunit
MTLAAFRNGASNVDPAVYEQDSFIYFRSVAAATGANPEQLVDHVKRIPKQIIQIVKDDPKVLDSCRNFGLALVGPP